MTACEMLLYGAVLGASSDVGAGITLMIVGMGVVFLALALIASTVGLLRRAVERSDRAGGSATTTVPGAPAAVVVAKPEGKPGLDPAEKGLERSVELPLTEVGPELVAVLTAAAVAALGLSVRVRRIAAVGRVPGSPWTAGGRAVLMASHNPRAARPGTGG